MAAPECLRCGTCCFSASDDYVRVSGEDHARLGERAAALVAWSGNRAFMRMQGGHCAALRLEPSGGAFVCTVYERRPQICRDLERGSPACEGELAMKGDRPPRALRAAAEPSPS